VTAVSDTSPLRHLIAAGWVNLIEHIFRRVLIPRAVEQELIHRAAPKSVRQWMAQRPSCFEAIDLAHPPDSAPVQRLDRGEAEAIHLATSLDADFLLMDEHRGRQTASARGITVIGILGILLESYRRGLIQDPVDILAQLRATRFRVSRRLVLEFEDQIRRIKSNE
jgi:uncharacterized protein